MKNVKLQFIIVIFKFTYTLYILKLHKQEIKWVKPGFKIHEYKSKHFLEEILFFFLNTAGKAVICKNNLFTK